MKSKVIGLWILSLLVLCVLVSGCATLGAKGRKTVTHTLEGPKEWPSWTKNPGSRSTKDEKAFAGQSLGLWASERSAIESAMTAAKREALHYLWGEMIDTQVKAAMAKGGVDTEVLYTQEAEKLKEERKAKGIVRGERKDYVSRRIEEIDPDGNIKTGWQAWVLYMVPKSAMSEYAKEFMRDLSAGQKDAKAAEQIKNAIQFVDEMFEKW